MMFPPKRLGAVSDSKLVVTESCQHRGLRNVNNYTIWVQIVKKKTEYCIEMISTSHQYQQILA